jgi:hypothetical protein
MPPDQTQDQPPYLTCLPHFLSPAIRLRIDHKFGQLPGAFFVIPSIFILWALSYVYVSFGTIPWIAAIFYGLKPAVLAIVAAAVIQMSMACTRVPMTRGLDTPRVANDQRLSCSKAAPHRKVLIRARSKCIWMN